MKKDNIILIGFMGSGKTSVGKTIVNQTGRRFLDTDELIVQRESRTINAIFAEDGEAYFRDLETQVLKDLLAEDLSNSVISVGGGLPVREENRTLLKELGTVIYLTASPDTLVNRLSGAKDRPLLQGHDLRSRIMELMERREVLYQAAKDVLLVTDELSREQAAEACVRLAAAENN